MKYSESNNNNNSNNLSAAERAQLMIKYLEKLSNMEYSDYKPEESYSVYERSRGKESE